MATLERPFQKGDRVRITCPDGRVVEGEVLVASPNGRSLMLGFDAIVSPTGALGGYVGMMPVLQDDDGAYRDLAAGAIMKLERTIVGRLG